MPHITLPEGLPGIRGPMAFRPETAKPLNELVDVLLRGPHTLSPGERELRRAQDRLGIDQRGQRLERRPRRKRGTLFADLEDAADEDAVAEANPDAIAGPCAREGFGNPVGKGLRQGYGESHFRESDEWVGQRQGFSPWSKRRTSFMSSQHSRFFAG